MCRNIKTLHNFRASMTDDEIQAAALQYVRKVSGSQKPSKANEFAFGHDRGDRRVGGTLLAQLVTTAPPRDHDVEAARARVKAEKRFGRAA